MRKLLMLFLLSIVLLGGSACNRATERAAFKAQAQLDEAMLQMEVRQFDRAFDEAMTAYKTLDELLSQSPNNVDVKLLRIRALLTLFMTRNTLLIEQAAPLPRSLVRLPDKKDYRDYAQYATPALEALKEMVNTRAKYSDEEEATIYGNLGAVFRLDKETAQDSAEAYGKAAEAYRHWLFELKGDSSKIGSHQVAIQKVRHQLRSMLMNEAEALLLAENWVEALGVLKEAAGGEDLKFFTVHFDLLEQRIANVQTKIKEQEEAEAHSREVRLEQVVRDRKKRNLSKRGELGGYNPYQADLLFTQSELADLKNNLMYRIICLANLNQDEELKKAREVLRTHYPEADSSLWSLLLQNRESKR